MSRHRDVRNMDYTEDYDGYDDIYGHSVDDDYCISPSNRQFIFNRENSRDQPKIGEFIRTEQDIKEEDETDLSAELSDLDKAKLESCLEQIKTILNPLTIPKNELVNIIISHRFDMEKITNAILTDSKNTTVERKDKGETKKASKFFIPKLNGFKEGVPLPFRMNSEKPPGVPAKFNNLSDLVSSHLSKSFQTKFTLDSKKTKLDQTVEKLENLQINPVNFDIDLSVALKSTPSGHSKIKEDLKEQKFEIPFVDCEVDVQHETILQTVFDVKNILDLYVVNAKEVSNFGKVLCRRFKIRNRVKVKHESIPKSKFSFLGPSPDDSIAKHLKYSRV